MNEEYRSPSDGHEASREELLSMNAQLQTANAELKAKLADISTAHCDLQNLTSATEIGTLFLDSNLRIRMFTSPMAELFNITDTDIGRAITDFTHQLRYDAVEADARRVLRDLMPVEGEVQSRDGRWFLMRLRPYRTIEDRVDGVVLTFIDITARRRAELELDESRARYQSLFNSIDEGFCVIDVLFDADGAAFDYRFVDVNAAFTRQTGLESAVGQTILQLAPGLEKHWFETYGRIARTGTPERFEAPAEPLGRVYEAYGFPVNGNGGNLVGVLFRDVTERRAAEEHRDLLTHELSHRVKNTLAVVQALARPANGRDMSVETYRERLIGRIQALGRAHGQLLDTSWQSADLGRLIADTLAPYGKTGQRLIAAEGPEVRLPPKHGLGLSLILHELATNASKYGPLSVDDGALSVHWGVSGPPDDATVTLTWQERNGPAVAETIGQGFGTQLIQRSATYELGGTAALQFDPQGFEARIEFPLPRLGSEK